MKDNINILVENMSSYFTDHNNLIEQYIRSGNGINQYGVVSSPRVEYEEQYGGYRDDERDFKISVNDYTDGNDRVWRITLPTVTIPEFKSGMCYKKMPLGKAEMDRIVNGVKSAFNISRYDYFESYDYNESTYMLEDPNEIFDGDIDELRGEPFKVPKVIKNIEQGVKNTGQSLGKAVGKGVMGAGKVVEGTVKGTEKIIVQGAKDVGKIVEGTVEGTGKVIDKVGEVVKQGTDEISKVAKKTPKAPSMGMESVKDCTEIERKLNERINNYKKQIEDLNTKISDYKTQIYNMKKSGENDGNALKKAESDLKNAQKALQNMKDSVLDKLIKELQSISVPMQCVQCRKNRVTLGVEVRYPMAYERAMMKMLKAAQNAAVAEMTTFILCNMEKIMDAVESCLVEVLERAVKCGIKAFIECIVSSVKAFAEMEVNCNNIKVNEINDQEMGEWMEISSDSESMLV